MTIFLFGLALLMAAMAQGQGSNFSDIAKIAGGMITITSLQLFNMGRKRFERIGMVRSLQSRWAELADDEGTQPQLAQLNEIILKLFRDNLSGAL